MSGVVAGVDDVVVVVGVDVDAVVVVVVVAGVDVDAVVVVAAAAVIQFAGKAKNLPIGWLHSSRL
jgi:hypothetical protein